ncbi:MAG TPA: hypothetical protein VKA84_02730 [Gemmatimonadaceae bacterium]|nr:hypothetical protein [Gemmatimonadaceae bacterium]
MHVDRASLADLDVLEQGLESSALVALLDHTWSQGGRTKLREMVRNPLSTIDGIRSRQVALQRIAGLSPSIPPSRDLGAVLARVERYLASTYIELPSSRAGLWLVRRRYPEVVGSLVEGIEATQQLLRLAAALTDSLRSATHEQTELQEIEWRVRACLDAEQFRRLSSVRPRAPGDIRLGVFDESVRLQGRALLQSLLDAVHEFDALQSLARASSREGFSYPQVVEASAPFLDAEGVFHPALRDPVRNDLAVGAEARLVFLTGPNMAGKSTLLRACGLLVLMAHLGMAVPAARARLSRFDRLCVMLTTRDSLQRGESFFLAEVRRVGELVDYLQQQQRVFAVVDELFKGTNVLDAYDATELVVSCLARCPTSVFIVASHLAELARVLDRVGSVSLLRMEAAVTGGVPHFSFIVGPGVSEQRLGMVLLEQTGVARALRAIVDGNGVGPSPSEAAPRATRSPTSSQDRGQSE